MYECSIYLAVKLGDLPIENGVIADGAGNIAIAALVGSKNHEAVVKKSLELKMSRYMDEQKIFFLKMYAGR